MMLSSALYRPSTIEKLGKFSSLAQGWKYGRGGPISADVISLTRKIYKALFSVGFYRTDAFAGSAGEVLLTAYHRDHYVAVTVEPGGSISFIHELGRVECCSDDNISMETIRAHIRRVAKEIWGTSGSSTRTISTTSEVSSTTSHLRIPLAVEGCRYFIRAVALTRQAPTAPTPESGILT